MSLVRNATTSESHWLNKKDMAESLGISVQAFDKWGVAPIAKVGRSVYFTAADVVANRVNNEIGKHQPKSMTVPDPEEGEVNLDFERYRLTRAQADAQELKNEIARQEVVPADFAVYSISKIAAEASGVIDSIPLNITRKHPELSTVQIENIKRELAKALNSMSRLGSALPEILDDYIRETTD